MFVVVKIDVYSPSSHAWVFGSEIGDF